MKIIIALVATLTLAACSATNVPTQQAEMGTAGTWEDLNQSIQEPGVIVFRKHTAADWVVNLSGLVNLNHPKAVEAGLTDRPEPIQIYTYEIEHPTAGTYLIDSGVSDSFRAPADNEDVSFIVKMAMGLEQLTVHLTTSEIAQRANGIDGVFLSHIHMDHIMGLRDLDASVPVYIGPGDAAAKDPSHAATASTTNNLLGNVDHLKEWNFTQSAFIDVFADGSLWAIHSPGHTPGATAYLANTTSGPELMLGDVTHTKWGWNNGVEPGSFSADQPTSAISLKRLVELAEAHPHIKVHPGHQSL